MKSYSGGQETRPLISVGIPTFNRPDQLHRTLLELTRQTYANIEIIVSDNASPSAETDLIVREFVATDPRIKYFRQTENIGIHPNFQFVLSKAVGEYFIWAADDDWHEPDFIESLWEVLRGNDHACAAFCHFDIRNAAGEKVLGYPDPTNTLRMMAGSNATIRLARFFILGEGKAVPHIIYGLIPMRVLRNFSWTEHIRRYGPYGPDTLFIFWLLGKGELALVSRTLFGCTVNNQKHYETREIRSLKRKVQTGMMRLTYFWSFLRIADRRARVVLLLLAPIKFTEMILSMFVFEPWRNSRKG